MHSLTHSLTHSLLVLLIPSQSFLLTHKHSLLSAYYERATKIEVAPKALGPCRLPPTLRDYRYNITYKLSYYHLLKNTLTDTLLLTHSY